MLRPPEVQYGAQKSSSGYGRQPQGGGGGNKVVTPHNGGWDLRNVQFLDPAAMDSYGIACMAPRNMTLERDLMVCASPCVYNPLPSATGF